MVKQRTKIYISSGHDSTAKFVFDVKNTPQKHCGKPTDVYPTIYDSFNVAITSEDFDLRSRRNVAKERNGATSLLQYVAPTENKRFDQLYAYDPKHTSHKTSDEDMYLNMEYEMHLGRKLDYFFFQSRQLLHAFEIQLLKNQSQRERTQMLTILKLSPENPRLTGYMLTGKCSMFLESDCTLAWLYHWPRVHCHFLQWTSVKTKPRYSTRARFSLLMLLHLKQTRRLIYKNVSTESKTSSNLAWIRKTYGIY